MHLVNTFLQIFSVFLSPFGNNYPPFRAEYVLYAGKEVCLMSQNKNQNKQENQNRQDQQNQNKNQNQNDNRQNSRNER